MSNQMMNIFLGLIILVFALALSIATPDIFNFSEPVEELIRYGFIILGFFGIVIGVKGR